MGAGCVSSADKVIDSKSSKKKPTVVTSSPVIYFSLKYIIDPSN